MSYSQEVLRRVRQLERVGTLEGDDVGTGEVGTLDEGTVMRIQVKREGVIRVYFEPICGLLSGRPDAAIHDYRRQDNLRPGFRCEDFRIIAHRETEHAQVT